MRTIVRGVTLVELILYVGLLSVTISLLFSFTLQMHKNKNLELKKHIDLNTIQIALDAIVSDIKFCDDLEVAPGKNNAIVCKTSMGSIKWEQDKDTIRRIENKTGRIRPGVSKVAENIKNIRFGIADINMRKLVAIKIVNLNGSVISRKIVIRKTMGFKNSKTL